MSDKLSIVLFSGTEDKLHAAATITAGAAAMGMPVSVLLMYWAWSPFGPIASTTTTVSRTTRRDRAGTSRSSPPVALFFLAQAAGPMDEPHREGVSA